MCDVDKNQTPFIPGGNTANLSAKVLADALHRLGEEILRISDRLAPILNQAENALAKGGHQGLADKLTAIISTREERARRFPASLFSDPAWDILLHLLRAELHQVRISFTRLAEQANVAPTTAHRWIAILVNKGIVIRHDDHFDARRTYVELHPNASATLRGLIDAGSSPSGL